jgi:hypothetical protein
MTKAISRTELTHKALSAVRQQPGCEAVKEVSVTVVEDGNGRTLQWHLLIVDSGEVSAEHADYAAKYVHDMLAVRYELA